ncbi:UNVERIFIED_ORG: hypothetical protein QE446_003910 [Rhizobium sp. SORGH_AS260]|uniref:STM4504/CBY_0614 family protein n=1 Tax=Agrobacterium sp. SORGH_AS_0440 TaxID=3041757 RepID=UPI00278640C5|nr:hypothetical protein [Agrobacterium sp. SORGH_AS_0440]MDP9732130.1 hypothetical protein [Rhizobium sp. SORGH_AS_0285]MDP9756034.1 hypothetical protein [Rhizobium sp. SORGH_AS_0260]MDR6081303.1 hypothetical protein [Agrobacterium sp. SORGH_AS_0440]
MIFETFWQRQKQKRGEVPDVYAYDELPNPLRVQIVTIMHEVVGNYEIYSDHYARGSDNVRKSYEIVVTILRREFGLFQLPHRSNRYELNYLAELTEFILGEEDVEKVLSAVELLCRIIERQASKSDYRGHSDAETIAKDALAEINARMRRAGVGYEYIASEIVRIDSEFVHAEAVRPALLLLQDKIYAGADEEFRSAFDHFRKGKTKECLTDALKAFESTMKIICNKRRWQINQNDTAKKLIDVCLENGLIPSYWQNHFSSLRSMLESSVPTARNKTSGHGQGVIVQAVPDYLASYVLHMTASTILFLINAERGLR